jgi:hypothetical protein
MVPGYARNDTDCSGVDRWYQNSRVKQVEYGFSDGKLVDGSFDTNKAAFQSTKIGDQVTTVLHVRPLALAAPGGPLYLANPHGAQWPKNLLAPNFMISEIQVHGSFVGS